MREPHVLIVSGNAGLAEQARQCLSESRPPVSVQWLRDAAVALARVGGGDIEVLVIDAASIGASGDDLRDLLERLHTACARTRTIEVSESADWTSDLRRIVAIGSRHTEPSGARPSSSQMSAARMIGFLGAKGGVGTTTVALSAACTLAEKHAVVLAELGSGNDTLTLHAQTTAKSPGPPGAPLNGLWSVRGIPGLRIALAQSVFAPETVAGELEATGAGADYLLLDLGSAVTQLVRCALPRLDALAVVVDLEASSVECARRVLSVIGQPDVCPRGTIGVVVVNRASLACPLSVDQVQRLLGTSVVGAIPPAADLCSAAQKARRPVAVFEPESLAARCLVQIAFSFAELV
jgi:MinD-like ATPase involved in chromosome partitioning or flagellar assembly